MACRMPTEEEPCTPRAQAEAEPIESRSRSMKLLSVEVTTPGGNSEVYSLPQSASVRDLERSLSPCPSPRLGTRTVCQLFRQCEPLDNAMQLQDLGLDHDNKLRLHVMYKAARSAKPDEKPVCESLQDDMVSVHWLVRADKMLRKGSNEREKSSRWSGFERDGHDWKVRLRLLPTARSFGESQGHGKVQVCFDAPLLEGVPPPLVSIRVGEQDWQGPQAILQGVKPCFELPGVQWDFRDAAESTSGVLLLAIAVELRWP